GIQSPAASAFCKHLEPLDITVSRPPYTAPSGSQIENNDQIISQYTVVFGTKMLVKTGIIIQPPKRRPAEDHQTRPTSTQALQFADGSFVIRRVSPVLPISFQEGHVGPFAESLVRLPLILVNQDVCITRSD